MAALSPNQRAFASTLAARTGLDPRLVSAWIVAEEPAGASTPVGHNDQNWLNIGNTDSRWYAGASSWKDPVRAANASAAWLQGKLSIPGFGKAAPGIVAFSRTAGQPVQNQIRALQQSGWASSGYPNLPQLVAQQGGNLGPAGSPFQTQTTTTVDQQGLARAQRLYELGQVLRSWRSPFDAFGPRAAPAASDPLLQVLPQTAPNPADYTRAVTSLKQLAGGLAVSAPPTARGGIGFTPAPGTNYSTGQEAEIARRLDRLAKDLGLRLTGISGYRSPQHSVAVGGFANDPHTRGAASDTQGIESVPESVLWKYGLTRPFSGSREANHVQLRGSVSWGSGQVAP